jgi:small subunit ribosomal protein S20
MPNKHSAEKALRQTKRHVVQNQARRDSLKSAFKKVLNAKTVVEAKKLISIAQKALDKAAKTGVIKKNTAARRLSRLVTRVNKMEKK